MMHECPGRTPPLFIVGFVFVVVKVMLVALMLSFVATTRSAGQPRPLTAAELGIEVSGGSREVVYTNKQAGVYYTETNAVDRSAWQGWRIMSKEVLKGYRLVVEGRPLLREDAIRALVQPHQFKRFYANGIEETVTLLDSINALVIEIDHVQAREVTIYPMFSDALNEEDYITDFYRNVLLILHKDRLIRTPEQNYPAAVAVSWVQENLWTGGFYDSTLFGENFSPANTRTVNPIPRHVAVIAVGDSADEAVAVLRLVAKNYDSLIAVRKRRMERLLNDSYFTTDNPRFDKALNWAKISMDALIMNQQGKGIFAGLPWHDRYRGRDTYISLPGAALVTGNFSEAKQIVRSFAQWQDTEVKSSTFGRIPNQVTTTSRSYNTADGTPLFTIALAMYLNYTGDTAFAREMYPAVKRAIGGTLRYHTDSLYFLTHGDAETWMDAVGTDGAWSPRGNRANDIQGLWYAQLRAAISVGEAIGLKPSADSDLVQWSRVASGLKRNFQRYFVDARTNEFYDHLNRDGSPDHQLRPNQLPDLWLFQNGASAEVDARRRTLFRTITETLVYPHGVASLSQADQNFHPYHHHVPYYVPEAAYHNGIVWTGLAGRWIDMATEYGLSDLAFQVTENMVHQILDRGAVGTLSELLDAAPRPGEEEPGLSGAYSQAWSVSEFIRNWYQSYLGISVLSPSSIVVQPRLPKSIARAHFVVPLSTGMLEMAYQRAGDSLYVNVELLKGSRDVSVLLRSPLEFVTTDDDKRARIAYDDTSLAPHGRLNYRLDKKGIWRDGRLKTGTFLTYNEPEMMTSSLAGIQLAKPFVQSDLRALKGPPYRVLVNSEIKMSNVAAKTLYDASDPKGDDKGSGGYTYPLTTNLKAGSLDIRQFTVSADKHNVFFKLQFQRLSNPGWHPEYGFQLTYAAIAIDKDGKLESGERNVRMNSKYMFPKSFGYESIIYVGGGVRISDAAGKVVAEYLPVENDAKNPLGDVHANTVSFSVPIGLIGSPTPSWRFAVLVGAQDDHGGSGVGEFRDVDGVASEWKGGGKKNANTSNVYDTILPNVK